MKKEITIQAPATVANLVCGFDVLGLCLAEPYDIMQVRLLDKPQVIIRTTDHFPLPSDPALNTAGAVVAANELLGNIFSREELVRFAMYGEKVASGVKHADNVAPCIYGGVTLIRSIFPLDIIPIESPELFVTVLHPQIEVRTSDAREILRKEVLLKDAIRQWGNIGGLVAGLMKGDYDLIGRSLEDVIIEPVRSILIPGFDRIKTECKEAGAIGGGISGSGPSIFMLSRDQATAKIVAAVMKSIYDRIGVSYHIYVTTINRQGVKKLNA